MIEVNETPEEACIREVKEETGYDVSIIRRIYSDEDKFTYLAQIVGGELKLDKNNPENKDLVDNGWIPLEHNDKWDNYTLPVLNIYLNSHLK